MTTQITIHSTPDGKLWAQAEAFPHEAYRVGVAFARWVAAEGAEGRAVTLSDFPLEADFDHPVDCTVVGQPLCAFEVFWDGCVWSCAVSGPDIVAGARFSVPA